MKKCAFLALTVATLLSMVAAQDAIENSAKPLSANAGRVVTLKEEMRIEDTGEDFFFKTPYTIRVSSRGDIFIQDGQEQALQFDPKGRFVRNLFKKGQGPGELSALLDIWVAGDRIYLLGFPPKVLVYDHDGNLRKELSPRDIGITGRLLRADEEAIIIRKTGRPDPAAGGGFRDIPQDIVEISASDAASRTVGSFPIRGFVQVHEGGAVGTTAWNQLQAVSLDENNLILNYTPEYMVEVFARDKGAVVRRFRRPYARVKRSGGGGVTGTGGSGPPTPEYWPDIFALHIVDGKIWVQTSTVTEGKGILFDVFDPEGRYVDSFYLRSPSKDPSGKPVNKSMTMAGGFAYFSEKTDDELIVIKKCRLVGL